MQKLFFLCRQKIELKTPCLRFLIYAFVANYIRLHMEKMPKKKDFQFLSKMTLKNVIFEIFQKIPRIHLTLQKY